MILAMQDDTLITVLRPLGFTDLEARIYLHLLRQGPETGYSIGKAISKPTANVYMAIESLQDKGAAEITSGEPRLCRATPVEELLSAARSRFSHSLEMAEKVLPDIDPTPTDDAVYQLGSAAQVIERARALLANAQVSVVIDALPAIATELAPDMIGAAERGVSIAALVYEPIDLPGVETILHSMGARVRELIDGEHLLISRDACEIVLALLDPPTSDGTWSDAGAVRQAIYTASPFIAWNLHDNFHHQLFTYAVAESLAQDDEISRRLMDIYKKRLRAIAPIRSIGWQTMLKRFGSEGALRITEEFLAESDRKFRENDGDTP